MNGHCSADRLLETAKPIMSFAADATGETTDGGRCFFEVPDCGHDIHRAGAGRSRPRRLMTIGLGQQRLPAHPP